MRILCLDVGKKRIGLAISDPMNIIANVLNVINVEEKDIFFELNAIINKYKVEKVVIGLPLNKTNEQMNENVKKINTLADEIRNRFKIEVVLWDERFSTKAVERILDEADMHWKEKRNIVDKLAAAYILQGYLDWLNNQKKSSE